MKTIQGRNLFAEIRYTALADLVETAHNHNITGKERVRARLGSLQFKLIQQETALPFPMRHIRSLKMFVGVCECHAHSSSVIILQAELN